MARTAEKVTVIRFANGRELMVQPSPDEVAAAIEQHEGGLTRLVDFNGNPAWINPADIVTITSHRPRRRRPAAAKEAHEELPQRLTAELAALADAPPSRRQKRR